jgi:glycosyltransferase involved in cell wall biosynthesis
MQPVPSAPLRVAMLAPISWRVPPRHYGPWEQFVSLLTEGLVGRGVDVTLFATADSVTQATLVGTAPTGYSEDPTLDAKVWEGLHIATAFERASEFDLMHNNFDFLPLTYSGLVDTPVVTTVHGFSSERIVPVFERYDGRAHYVSISDADRHPNLTYDATIHHGIDMAGFPLGQAPEDRLLFFGRIHPDKGVEEAIEVAARADMPLTIAGIVQDTPYFEERVRPRIDGERVTYIGAVGPAERGALLSSATAMLHLINFEEPFGFSVVESMACGTPVIARRRGSMPEIVQHGVNGALVDTAGLDEAVAAIDDVRRLDRATVRASVEGRFDVSRMVEDYLALYRRIVDPNRAMHAVRRAS